jgi:hypothetical protein
MDHKDFKKEIEKKLKEKLSFDTWLKTAKERVSRPKVLHNILQPGQNEKHED